MAKKNSRISKDEFYETTSDEQITGEQVDSIVNPDGNTIDASIDESEKVTVEMDESPVTTDSETPVVENLASDAIETVIDEQDPTTDVTYETPVADEQNSVTPEVTKTPVTDEKPITPVDEGTGDTDSTDDKILSDKEPVKIDEFKRFNIRFGYSIDSRSTTTRRALSTTEIVKLFVKAPTCFIAFETTEDLKDFETLLKIKNIKVEDKEGKFVDFSDAAKKHLVERVTELSKYWIYRNSK